MATSQSGLAFHAASPQDRVMLTGAQIRAARALLRWSTRDLADKASVGIATIHRAEAVDDMPSMHARTLMTLKGTFEAAGIEFVDGRYSGDGGPGVRLKA